MGYTKSFFRNMSYVYGLIGDARDKGTAKVWLSVREYILKGNYSTYKYANKLGQYLLEGYSEGQVASILGIEGTTVRIHIRNVSNSLYSLFGNDFFILIEKYLEDKDISILEELESRVNCVVTDKKALDILGDALFLKFSKMPLNGEYKLDDCSKEIEFCVKHCIKTINSELEWLSLDKISYLIGLLDGKVGNQKDRLKLLKYFDGERS